MNSRDWKEANGWGPNGVKTRAVIEDETRRERADRIRFVSLMVAAMFGWFVLGVVAVKYFGL